VGIEIEFEFDERKSIANKAKHGIDFVEIQALWLDEDGVDFPTRIEGEARWIRVGKITQQFWAAVFTVREERVRLISARRARLKEVALHESEGV
jgi:hypothetical protein